MVREMSTENSDDCEQGHEPHSDPISSEEPPSYEESLCDGNWDTNLTWPSTLVNRDELAQIFRLNNYDYSTRGRAFTVSGPAEIQAPKYRNIINYFENSLEDMSSIEWSTGSGAQRSALQLQNSPYSCSDIESGHIVNNRNGPKTYGVGKRTTSKDVIHLEYIDETRPNSRTRFTVRLVPETDEDPPNYSFTDNSVGAGVVDIRPKSTSGTCVINNNDRRHCSVNQNISSKHQLSKQPSAPSLDQINQPEPMQRSESWYSAAPHLGRTVTAPGILESRGVQSRDSETEEGKTVSFYLGDDMSSMSTNLEKKGEEAKIYNDSDYSDHIKKESRSSETGDSGYGDETCPPTDMTPLKISDIAIKNRDNFDHVISMEKDSSRSNLMSRPEDWENHRLFRTEEPKSGTSCTIWLAVLFFLCDVAMIVSGALLLILNYHGNVITGFVLLGLGIGMCIPALNYIGGLPTLCTGIQS